MRRPSSTGGEDLGRFKSNTTIQYASESNLGVLPITRDHRVRFSDCAIFFAKFPTVILGNIHCCSLFLLHLPNSFLPIDHPFGNEGESLPDCAILIDFRRTKLLLNLALFCSFLYEYQYLSATSHPFSRKNHYRILLWC